VYREEERGSQEQRELMWSHAGETPVTRTFWIKASPTTNSIQTLSARNRKTRGWPLASLIGEKGILALQKKQLRALNAADEGKNQG